MGFFQNIRSAACVTTVLAANICNSAVAEDDFVPNLALDAVSVPAEAETPAILDVTPPASIAPLDSKGPVRLATELIRER